MRSKLLTTASFIALAIGIPAMAFAAPPSLPTGASFRSGTGGSTTQSGPNESVNFSNSNGPGVINWTGGFDIAAGNTVSFANTGSGPSTIINNDTSGALSSIDGTISAPGVSVVVVNPNGISVGAGAVLPSQFALAAGTYDAATGQITASNSPVTIAQGVTLGTAPSTNADSITVVASSGSTLPVSQGITDNIDVPSSGSSFGLSANGTGDYQFGPQPGAASSGIGTVTVDGGSASGATVGNESVTTQAGTTGSLTVQNVDSNGSILVTTDGNIGGTLKADNLTATAQSGFNPFAAAPLTVDSVGNVEVAGKIAANYPAGTTGSSGSFSPLITIAEGVGAGNPVNDSSLNTNAAAPNGSTRTLTLDSGTLIDAANGSGGVNVAGDNIDVGGPVKIESAPVGGSALSANNAIQAAPGAIDPAISTTSGFLTAETGNLDGVSLLSNSPGTSSQLNVKANSISNSNLIGSTINILPPEYDTNSSTAAPTALSMSSVNISTSSLAISDIYGAALNNVQMSKPSGGQFPTLSIGPSPFGQNNGFIGYVQPGNGPVSLSITNSTLYGASNSIVQAGQPRGNGVVEPGSISLVNSSITSGPNSIEAAGPITLYAAGGGTVSIDANSTVSSDGGLQCDQSGAACGTSVMAGNIGFGTGNKETASGSNVYSGTISGRSNGTPAETAGNPNPVQNPGGVVIQTYAPGNAPAGSATIDGYLNAGGIPLPSNVGPAGLTGSTGSTGATGQTGGTGPAGPAGPAGANGVGIASTTINSSGDLIITLTNGTTQNAGAVVGANGVGIQSAAVDSSGNLIVTLTNGTTQNVGKVLGANGSNGTNGVGIASTAINSSGDLIVTLTNGTTQNAGAVVGTNGVNGTNGVGIQSAAFDSSGNLIVTLTNGTTQNVGKVLGNTGPAGPAGANGTIGATGPQGPAGPAGKNGTNGTNGLNGVGITTTQINSFGDLIITLSNGQIINNGEVVGSNGAIGPQGPRGPAGPQGPAGLNGTNTILTTAGIATVSPITVQPSTTVSTPTLTGNQMLVPESSTATTSSVSVTKKK